jgi:hypothetical protein
VAQAPPLVKGLDASHELKLALDFTLGGCAEELIRKHVASRKNIMNEGKQQRKEVRMYAITKATNFQGLYS